MYADASASTKVYPTKLTLELLEHLEQAEALVQEQARADTIHVSEITGLPAFAYEKIRNFIDYKDELLLRKNAIRRFLKRRLLLPRLTPASGSAQGLVRDLILSRYLKNDHVAQAVLIPVTQIIEKYQALYAILKVKPPKVPRWREAIMGLAAVECDAYLVPPTARLAFTNYAVQLLETLLKPLPQVADPVTAHTQLVLAVQRVLDRADNDMTGFTLLRHQVPDWFHKLPAEAAATLAPQIEQLLEHIKIDQINPYGRRVLPLVKRLLMPLLVLRDILQTNNVTERKQLMHNPDSLANAAAEAYQARWLATRRSIRRKGFHAMTYIFLTKVVIATLIEYPYERFIVGHLALVPLTINLLFPPLLMAVITLLVKAPGQLNETQVVNGALEMAYGGEPNFLKMRELKPRSKSVMRQVIYGVAYLITISATLGLLSYVLKQIGFNPMSGALFLFFISLVSFFGIGLRQQARQLKVIEGRETISGFVIDFFTLPIVAIGKWLSTTFDRINIFVFILDFLFEAPFKLVLKILEEWFQFLKEKKDEMY